MEFRNIPLKYLGQQAFSAPHDEVSSNTASGTACRNAIEYLCAQKSRKPYRYGIKKNVHFDFNVGTGNVVVHSKGKGGGTTKIEFPMSSVAGVGQKGKCFALNVRPDNGAGGNIIYAFETQRHGDDSVLFYNLLNPPIVDNEAQAIDSSKGQNQYTKDSTQCIDLFSNDKIAHPMISNTSMNDSAAADKVSHANTSHRAPNSEWDTYAEQGAMPHQQRTTEMRRTTNLFAMHHSSTDSTTTTGSRNMKNYHCVADNDDSDMRSQLSRGAGSSGAGSVNVDTTLATHIIPSSASISSTTAIPQKYQRADPSTAHKTAYASSIVDIEECHYLTFEGKSILLEAQNALLKYELRISVLEKEKEFHKREVLEMKSEMASLAAEMATELAEMKSTMLHDTTELIRSETDIIKRAIGALAIRINETSLATTIPAGTAVVAGSSGDDGLDISGDMMQKINGISENGSMICASEMGDEANNADNNNNNYVSDMFLNGDSIKSFAGVGEQQLVDNDVVSHDESNAWLSLASNSNASTTSSAPPQHRDSKCTDGQLDTTDYSGQLEALTLFWNDVSRQESLLAMSQASTISSTSENTGNHHDTHSLVEDNYGGNINKSSSIMLKLVKRLSNIEPNTFARMHAMGTSSDDYDMQSSSENLANEMHERRNSNSSTISADVLAAKDCEISYHRQRAGHLEHKLASQTRDVNTLRARVAQLTMNVVDGADDGGNQVRNGLMKPNKHNEHHFAAIAKQEAVRKRQSLIDAQNDVHNGATPLQHTEDTDSVTQVEKSKSDCDVSIGNSMTNTVTGALHNNAVVMPSSVQDEDKVMIPDDNASELNTSIDITHADDPLPMMTSPEIILDLSIVIQTGADVGICIAGGTDAPICPEDTGIYVTNIVHGSSVHQDGRLLQGDKIVVANGISLVNIPHAQAIEAIQKGGSADATGHLQTGDRLVSIDGVAIINETIEGTRKLLAACGNKSPVVTLCIARVHDSFCMNTTSGTDGTLSGQDTLVEDVVEISFDKLESGLGFSFAGGTDYQAQPGDNSIYITNITQNGAADLDGRLMVDDRVIEVNDVNLTSATHKEAIEALNRNDTGVKLIVSRMPLHEEEILTFDFDVSDAEGLGFSIYGGVDQHGVDDPGIVILRIQDNGAAARDGRLRSGDRLITVNGESLVDSSHDAAAHFLGQVRDHVSLTIARLSDHKTPQEIYVDIKLELPTNAKGFGFSIAGGTDAPIEEGGFTHRDGQLRFGDKLVQLNGIDLTKISHDDAISTIQGARGTIFVRVARLPGENEENEDILHVEFACVPQHRRLGMLIEGGCDDPVSEGDTAIYIADIAADGAAAADGRLRPGDRLLLCNGVGLADVTHEEALRTLQDHLHNLKLTISRVCLDDDATGLSLSPTQS